jgi:hypothetical protein
MYEPSMLTVTIASTYGSGDYSCGTLNSDNSNSSTCATTTAASSSGSLVDTGTAVAGFVTLACLIVIAAIIIRVVRRRKAVPTITRTPLTGTAETIDGDHPKVKV